MGRIAQLGERSPYKAEVTGSSPVPPTTLAPYRGAADGAGSVDPRATPRPVGLPVRKLPLLEQTPDLLSENLFVHRMGSVAGASQRRRSKKAGPDPLPRRLDASTGRQRCRNGGAERSASMPRLVEWGAGAGRPGRCAAVEGGDAADRIVRAGARARRGLLPFRAERKQCDPLSVSVCPPGRAIATRRSRRPLSITIEKD